MQGSQADAGGTSATLRVTQEQQSFTFTEVSSRPVPSLLRGFSAPVNMEVVGQSDEDLMFLLAHDSDAFSRWEAGQRLARKLVLKLYSAAAGSSKVGLLMHALLWWYVRCSRLFLLGMSCLCRLPRAACRLTQQRQQPGGSLYLKGEAEGLGLNRWRGTARLRSKHQQNIHKCLREAPSQVLQQPPPSSMTSCY